ncbi:uncharacterized protein SCHCODRAFT_02069422 [Schizophyllum commune H4-8]|uniref:Uncharacterized protein n=1 Tax=Schizophyllum commune (strain H4-8 / FGSC 9210) TaxID=578458 RepID=D8QFI4_SCHCM|nr:uncharacterized protein SCHCODRAFT_02069422 [Schizophyllum commune H4-8]KAI5887656.1 hypothetical protein SCHCODRAFT_02069422 [Schizophyllum commune H4-8]
MPANADTLDAPRVLDVPGTPEAQAMPGALETPDVLGAPGEPRTLERPAGAVDVPDTLGKLTLPAPLDALVGTLDEPDALETLEDVLIALFVAGCFVMVMGTAATAVARAKRGKKRMVGCRVLVTGWDVLGGCTKNWNDCRR